ncbi:MAG: hypothetical protein JXR86_05995, partial [Spirochaetales bacterium]|nr:hypothetical protein [Spirochaetales bacterium]
FLFNLYSAMVGKKHEITVMSTGDGSLQALELARNGVSAEKYLLLSPVHGERINRGAGFFQKIASLPYFHYLMPRLPYGYGRNRAGSFDILNDDLNAAFAAGAAKSYPPFADYASLSNIDRQARESSRSMDKVKPSRFFIIYGDDDLSYSLEGFERMGDALKEGGSEVTIMRISSSGRMLLFDNGKDRILDLLSILLQ